jgi:hypothetical protein
MEVEKKDKPEPPSPVDAKTESKEPVLSPREAAQIFGNLRIGGGLNQRRRYPYSKM